MRAICVRVPVDLYDVEARRRVIERFMDLLPSGVEARSFGAALPSLDSYGDEFIYTVVDRDGACPWLPLAAVNDRLRRVTLNEFAGLRSAWEAFPIVDGATPEPI